ncbi:hypothetical protein Dsin_029367 [Dipteronia sinensis]|uniref:Uncharacterized protein n=1 Tax=Dipteronia sinensis TaxID=43782 RepID=A0AAE0DVF1_9ROSI|nr:hypothetical protein Dsin_029367 [Dipteronia sinensis]
MDNQESDASEDRRVVLADRGAHTYWLGKGTVEVRPDHILNLIHYEDAASLSVAILKKKLCGRILLGCDNHPVSRQEVMDLVSKSGKFSKQFEGFTASEDEGILDLQGVLIIFIIALVMMAVCYQPPRRPTVYAVYRCRC